MAMHVNFQKIIRNSPDGVIIVDQTGSTLFVNPAAESMFGIHADDFQDRPFGYPVGQATEIQILKKLSERLFAEMRTTAIDWEGAPATLITLRDITERKKNEEALVRSRKTEAIAKLAGGIAHQFNNALFIIAGNVELLRETASNPKRIESFMQTIESTVQRMANLTAKLVAYSKQGSYLMEVVSLSRFVASNADIVIHALNTDTRLEKDLPDHVFGVRIDPVQIQIVLSELIANAAEAINGKGLIVVSTRNEEIFANFPGSPAYVKPGRYACIRVEDNGEGMDQETVEKKFDPFFTTRFHGRGLGLAAVMGIVEIHDGAVAVASEPGKGTMVDIFLPAVEE